jgi:SAM-dependent methyltransferase
MAIDPFFLQRIVDIGNREKVFPGGDVLILGDCQFHTEWSTGENAADRERFRRTYKLRRVETIDITGSPSIQMDLHQDAPEALRNQFDMIIDAGTLYNCFDVASVLRNCFEMLKDEGVIIHHSALTGYFGRAYYNIHPAMFKDLFEQNDFTITNMEVRVFKELSWFAKVQRIWRTWRGIPCGQYKRIGEKSVFLRRADFVDMEFTSDVATQAAMLPNDALILCAARRSKRGHFVKPIASFYTQRA